MARRSAQQQHTPNGEPETPVGFSTSRPSRVRFKHLVGSQEETAAGAGYIPPPPRVPRQLRAGALPDDELPPTRTGLPAMKSYRK